MKLKYVILVSFMVVSLKAAGGPDGDDLAHSKDLSVLENPLRLLLETHGSRLKDQDILTAFQGHPTLTHNARRAIQHKLFDAAAKNSALAALEGKYKKKEAGTVLIQDAQGDSVEVPEGVFDQLVDGLKELHTSLILQLYRAALQKAQASQQVQGFYSELVTALLARLEVENAGVEE